MPKHLTTYKGYKITATKSAYSRDVDEFTVLAEKGDDSLVEFSQTDLDKACEKLKKRIDKRT